MGRVKDALLDAIESGSVTYDDLTAAYMDGFHEGQRQIDQPVTITDSSGYAAVDSSYFWQPMNTCRRGVKVQLLGTGGVAMYGIFSKPDKFFTHWAPLPKVPKEKTHDN